MAVAAQSHSSTTLEKFVVVLGTPTIFTKQSSTIHTLFILYDIQIIQYFGRIHFTQKP
jgi:hypothetical protein